MRVSTIITPLLATGASASALTSLNATYYHPTGTVFTILPSGTAHPSGTGAPGISGGGTGVGGAYPSTTAPIDNGAAGGSFTFAGSVLAAGVAGVFAFAW